LRFLTTIDPTSYGRIGAMAWATGETMPDTAPQAAFPTTARKARPQRRCRERHPARFGARPPSGMVAVAAGATPVRLFRIV